MGLSFSPTSLVTTSVYFVSSSNRFLNNEGIWDLFLNSSFNAHILSVISFVLLLRKYRLYVMESQFFYLWARHCFWTSSLHIPLAVEVSPDLVPLSEKAPHTPSYWPRLLSGIWHLFSFTHHVKSVIKSCPFPPPLSSVLYSTCPLANPQFRQQGSLWPH
jgi:hypothetical protein